MLNRRHPFFLLTDKINGRGFEEAWGCGEKRHHGRGFRFDQLTADAKLILQLLHFLYNTAVLQL